VHPVPAVHLAMQPAMLDVDLRASARTFSAAIPPPGAGWLAVQTDCDSPPPPRVHFDPDAPAELRQMGETLALVPAISVRSVRLDFPESSCLLRHADWIAAPWSLPK
jgi:hypothetical protein